MGLTETLVSDVVSEEPHDTVITEISHTAEGITEIATSSEEEQKPVLIDMDEAEGMEKPPVVKNIRINRAKIIQKAAEDTEEELDVVENPTEQIIRPDLMENSEPETIMSPVTETAEKIEEQHSGTTVELTSGINIVKDRDEEPEKEADKPVQNSSVPKAMPYIVRVNTGERTMINKAVFKVGKATRGVDYTVKGNGAISKIHAIFYQREDGYYLKDNKATNTTYVNGTALGENEEVKLKNDSTIDIGGEDFIFKLS
jgi:hypothetical protein